MVATLSSKKASPRKATAEKKRTNNTRQPQNTRSLKLKARIDAFPVNPVQFDWLLLEAVPFVVQDLESIRQQVAPSDELKTHQMNCYDIEVLDDPRHRTLLAYYVAEFLKSPVLARISREQAATFAAMEPDELRQLVADVIAYDRD